MPELMRTLDDDCKAHGATSVTPAVKAVQVTGPAARNPAGAWGDKKHGEIIEGVFLLPDGWHYRQDTLGNVNWHGPPDKLAQVNRQIDYWESRWWQVQTDFDGFASFLRDRLEKTGGLPSKEQEKHARR